MSPEVPDPREGTTPVPSREGMEPPVAEPDPPRPFRRAAKRRDSHAVRTEASEPDSFARNDTHRARSSFLPTILLAVFLAGLLGTAARLGLDAAIRFGPGGIPATTLLVNTAGSFALGLVVATIPHTSPEWLRAGLTTGLLGSFTTFSALTVASVELTGSGGTLAAAATLITSVVAGVGATLAGIAVGARLKRGRL